MARFASQIKGFLSVATALGTSVCVGFASRRFDQTAGQWRLPAGIGFAFFVGQVIFAFTGSKEEAELAEYKRIQSAQNEKSAVEIETANDISKQMRSAIQSGSIEDAERWRDLRRDLYGE